MLFTSNRRIMTADSKSAGESTMRKLAWHQVIDRLNIVWSIRTLAPLIALALGPLTLHGCNVKPADSSQWNEVCTFVGGALHELNQGTIPSISPNSNKNEREAILGLAGQDFSGFVGIEVIDYEFDFYMMYVELSSGDLYYCCVDKLGDQNFALVSLERRTERVEKYKDRGAEWKVDCGSAV